jgi:Flp pilus assembly CpaF family ATPase
VDVVTALRPRVAVELEGAEVDETGGRWPQVVEQAVHGVLDAYAHEALAAGRAPLDDQVEAAVRRALVASFVGAGGLQALLDDDTVETINVNGCDNVWLHLRDGTRVRSGPVASSDEELAAQLRDLGARAGAHERRFGADHPELSMQLPDGSRLHAVRDITDRVVVSIRRHRLQTVSLADLVRLGELTSAMRDLFTAIVAARCTVVICGAPGIGKTTFLRALAHSLPLDRRPITVEDSYELGLDRTAHPNGAAMQAREANLEGVGAFGLDECVRAALRLLPDWVLVGEVRGPEVVTMLTAMTIGAGSMSTVHAGSSREALERFEALCMVPPARYPQQAAVKMIGQAVDFVVHLDLSTDGMRVVSSVREVVGDDGTQVISNEIYRPGPDRRAVPATRLRDETVDKLAAAGLDAEVLDEPGWWGP